MVGKIIIDVERCKGCWLCVGVCPNGCINVSEKSNSKGYFPAEVDNTNCTGCANCAVVCPDCAIVVYRADGINELRPSSPARDVAKTPSGAQRRQDKGGLVFS